eukprot:CAMPEP_0184696492 /NCGR_PEP_ID=MMETSP0313-20130426/3762_1 /TAXON_ID=2792 /ORGANISM="Porphyridium aerugineum, Strain SAG 1380-2" /LENGTH=446 /DNA_ID=CAMNT_0027155123 /DNA_START=200 /DNA_END=1537 /DNA_ORIENTATION=-
MPQSLFRSALYDRQESFQAIQYHQVSSIHTSSVCYRQRVPDWIREKIPAPTQTSVEKVKLGRDLAQLARLVQENELAYEALKESELALSDEEEWDENLNPNPNAENTFARSQSVLDYDIDSHFRFLQDTQHARNFLNRVVEKAGVQLDELYAIKDNLSAADHINLPKGILSYQDVLELFRHKDTLVHNLYFMQYPQADDTRNPGEVLPLDYRRMEREKKEEKSRVFEKGYLPAELGGPSAEEIQAEHKDLEEKYHIKKREWQNAHQLNTMMKNFSSVLLEIRMTSKVVKGGTNHSYRALVVVGNGKGVGGFAIGKGKEAKDAVEAATKKALRRLIVLDLYEKRTIYHAVKEKYVCSLVHIWPLGEGKGLRMCRQFMAALETIGIKDAGAKIHGSSTMINAVAALFKCLATVRSAEQIANQRGLSVIDINNVFRIAREKRASSANVK